MNPEDKTFIVNKSHQYLENKSNVRNMIKTISDKLDSISQIIYLGKSNNDFNSLFDLYGSDKGSHNEFNESINPFGFPHNYAEFYNLIFSPIRYQVENLFECGLGTNNIKQPSNMGERGIPGASLRAWRDYFPNADIFGADIDKGSLFNEERISTYFVDQTNPFLIKRMWNDIGIKYFDIIIDDGFHSFDAACCLYENSIDKLKRGGIYIIEDITLGFWPSYIDYFQNKNNCSYLIPFKKIGTASKRDNSILMVIKS